MQRMTFEDFQIAELVKITPDMFIEEGDYITHTEWKVEAYQISTINSTGYFTNYGVSGNTSIDMKEFNKRHEGKTGTLWAMDRSFFDGGNFYKVKFMMKDYDPEQQPYDEGDI